MKLGGMIVQHMSLINKIIKTGAHDSVYLISSKYNTAVGTWQWDSGHTFK